MQWKSVAVWYMRDGVSAPLPLAEGKPQREHHG
jgi:hypothetical protein